MKRQLSHASPYDFGRWEKEAWAKFARYENKAQFSENGVLLNGQEELAEYEQAKRLLDLFASLFPAYRDKVRRLP